MKSKRKSRTSSGCGEEAATGRRTVYKRRAKNGSGRVSGWIKIQKIVSNRITN
jgi:hypothetical protein